MAGRGSGGGELPVTLHEMRGATVEWNADEGSVWLGRDLSRTSWVTLTLCGGVFRLGSVALEEDFGLTMSGPTASRFLKRRWLGLTAATGLDDWGICRFGMGRWS